MRKYILLYTAADGMCTLKKRIYTSSVLLFSTLFTLCDILFVFAIFLLPHNCAFTRVTMKMVHHEPSQVLSIRLHSASREI